MENCQTATSTKRVIEEIDKQCGEVFISIDGSLIFLCTLCEIKYKGYQAYAEHIYDNHVSANLNNEDETITSDDQVPLESLCSETESIITFDPELESNSEPESDNDVLTNSIQNERSCQDVFYDVAIEAESTVLNAKNTKDTDKKMQKSHKHSCPYCDFIAKTAITLKMHILRHEGEKRHVCQKCEKRFYTIAELRSHSRTHTGERPYSCTECSRSFVAHSALWRHNKSCKDIRDKECTKCDMKFHNSVALRAHMAVHSDLRLYKCTKCHASFKLLKILRCHMKIHENKYEFKCRYCPASFNQQPGLSCHMRKVHPNVW